MTKQEMARERRVRRSQRKPGAFSNYGLNNATEDAEAARGSFYRRLTAKARRLFRRKQETCKHESGRTPYESHGPGEYRCIKCGKLLSN